MKKYPFVRQKESKGCGVACLAMIIKYYNGYISEDTLYDMTNTSKHGTSAYNLLKAAQTIGMKVDGFKCDVNNLKNIQLPCIAHVLMEQKYGHYIVIYEVNEKKKELYIADPASGKKKISLKEFNKIFTGVVLTMFPEKPLPLYQNDMKLKDYLKILILNYKKDWLKIWIESFICLLLSFVVSLSLIVMLQGVEINSKKWISYTIIIFIFLGIIKNIVAYMQEKLIHKIQHKIDIHLMLQAIKNIIYLPYEFYCNRSTGEVVSRLQDLEKVGYELIKIITLVCMDSTMAIISGILLYKLNYKIFYIIVPWIGMYILIVCIFKNIIRDKMICLKQKFSFMYNEMIETIKGFETIKGLQLEEHKTQVVSKKYIDYNQHLCDLEFLECKQRKWKNIISEIGYIISYGYSCSQVINGNLDISHVLILQTLITYFLLPIEHFLEMNTSIYDMKTSLQRALDIAYQMKEKDKLRCGKIKDIRVKGLTYERENKVLDTLSLHISSNQKIILMGESGSGKSTLLKLLRGYYASPNGKIYINGIDINSYTKESLGERITYISQNEILFTDSIYNNITMHRNCSEKEIIRQIKLNNIDEITKNKKTGLAEVIEEDGYNISGGERQRIVLARALLKQSDVILLDEAFSQMDSNLERKILKKLFQTYSKKIIVVVSHRKDNMDLFNTYIEMRNGKIHTHLSKSN